MLQAALKCKGVTHSSWNCPVAAFLSRPHPRPPNPQTDSVCAHRPNTVLHLLHRSSPESSTHPLLCHRHHHRLDRRSCSIPMGSSVLHVLWPCDVSEGCVTVHYGLHCIPWVRTPVLPFCHLHLCVHTRVHPHPKL